MWEGLISIGGAVIGLAIIAVLVSQRANTANVITAGGNAFSRVIASAVSPVTGNAQNTGYSGVSWPVSPLGGLSGQPYSPYMM
jgi:hypothetical protein